MGRSFVIVGEDRSDWKGFGSTLGTARARAAVWTSADGRAWTHVLHAPVFDVGGFIDTTEDPESGTMSDRFFATALGGTETVWTSVDGSAWSGVGTGPVRRIP